jgi:hypothetical protein
VRFAEREGSSFLSQEENLVSSGSSNQVAKLIQCDPFLLETAQCSGRRGCNGAHRRDLLAAKLQGEIVKGVNLSD